MRQLKNWLGGSVRSRSASSLKSVAGTPTAQEKNTAVGGTSNPVEMFYKEALQKHLAEFTSFAIQSRSLVIRDIFARVASEDLHDFNSLMNEIDAVLNAPEDRHTRMVARMTYDTDVLLSLTRLVLNSARSDLDLQTGSQLYKFIHTLHGDEAFTTYHKLLYIEVLAELRRYDEQGVLTQRFDIPNLVPLQAELIELDRVAYECSEKEWLSALNHLYDGLGMARVRLMHNSSLPLLDRLKSNSKARLEGPTITVLMPTYAPGAGIRTALRSLLEQTWTNLEIIVIDDGSPEEYDGILSEIEDLDARVRLVRQRRNAGAYVARNAGLAVATGQFVTVHDDDDWSHPEKLASQVEILLHNDSVMATTSAHVRTTEDMQFHRVNSKPQHLQTNYSSLMFRMSVADEIGLWDTANRGSDAEFFLRITEGYGTSSVVHLVDKPLSFSRVWAGSLTSGEMYRGYFAYSRLVFRSAFRQWHRSCRKNGIRPVLRSDQARPYAIPTTFEPGARHQDLGHFDVVYVTDFARQAKFSATVIDQIETAAKFGLRVGYLHLNSPRTLKRREISTRLLEMQRRGDVTHVAENDNARTDLMVVYDSAIGMFLDQFESSVKVKHGVVIDDHGIALRGAAQRDPSNLRQVLQHLDASFKVDFKIAGASVEEHDRLPKVVPPQRVLDERFVWTQHVPDDPGKISPPSATPVVGFHSFGNKYRWPSTSAKFRSVYFAENHRTKFYGRITPVRTQFGEDVLAEAEVYDSRDYPIDVFFESIDFWVYFPHEKLEVRTWRPVLDAMQAGKVVILPKRLEAIYGSSAVYADTADVTSVIEAYSRDEKKYIAQATRAQSFVAGRYDRQSYIGRISSLLSQNFSG